MMSFSAEQTSRPCLRSSWLIWVETPSHSLSFQLTYGPPDATSLSHGSHGTWTNFVAARLGISTGTPSFPLPSRICQLCFSSSLCCYMLEDSVSCGSTVSADLLRDYKPSVGFGVVVL